MLQNVAAGYSITICLKCTSSQLTLDHSWTIKQEPKCDTVIASKTFDEPSVTYDFRNDFTFGSGTSSFFTNSAAAGLGCLPTSCLLKADCTSNAAAYVG